MSSKRLRRMRGRRTSVNASSSVAIMALFSTSGLDLVQYQMPASHTQVLAIISKSTGRSQNPQNDCDYSQGSRHMESSLEGVVLC